MNTSIEKDKTSKIDLTKNPSLMDCIISLSEGIPGAAVVLAESVKNNSIIDPINALGAWGPIVLLDSYNIYGSDIWILYKDICHQSISKFLGILRCAQVGIISSSDLTKGISESRNPEASLNKNLENHLKELKKLLPSFNLDLN